MEEKSLKYEGVRSVLELEPRRWLITGVAGFIGSNLLEELLQIGQEVIGIDNFETGYRRNLEDVKKNVTQKEWARFRFFEEDIRDYDACAPIFENIDYVLHQAALGSVPRSLKDPLATNSTNIGGFLKVLISAKNSGVCRMVYAASSSTYGDHPDLPKVEEKIGNPLSPYAVTKLVNELYADVFSRCYEFDSVGLRYFNIFGKRQDPEGGYAAVIPKWIASIINGNDVYINGDGDTSRDFCFIDNAVQANILAATSGAECGYGQVYNVAVGGRITLNQLFSVLVEILNGYGVAYDKLPVYREFRPGDVRHSQADISKAELKLGYNASVDIRSGLEKLVPWYIRNLDLGE